ncbi:helix-turn-helix domain-containing protein [Myxococcus stipitatus]|uniref:helix-turn-helix domain-containing protein n=1 Tax=Myxococcus stipitatus TaxID=83455 RepID=UPI0030CF208D
MKPFAQQTYYELLEVPVTARMEEIRAAYARLMELYAPDSIAVYALVESDQVDALRARMTEAMEILTDSDLRGEYDKDLGLTPSPTARAAEALASIVAESPEESKKDGKKAPEEPVLSGPEAFRASFVSGYSLSYVTSSLQVAPLGGGLVDVPATLVRPEEPPASKAETRESSSAVDGAKGAQAAATNEVGQGSEAAASNPGSSSIAAETHTRAAMSSDGSADVRASSSAVAAASPVSAAPSSGQGSEMSKPTDAAGPTSEPSAANSVAPPSSSSPGSETSKSTDSATPTASVAASSPVHDTETPKSADAVQTTSSPAAAAPSLVHGAETSMIPEAVGAQTSPSSPGVGGPAPVSPEPAKSTAAAATRTSSSSPASAPRGPKSPEPAAPSTSIVVSSAPARSGSARPLGESNGLAQEPAVATGESAIGQASARTRDVRPRLPDIPSDAEFNGELLRRVREARGYTLHQVADRTRISSRHLENVEADRYTALPAQVYLRGILMNLARELGLDPLRVSKSYLALASEKSGKR